MDWQAKKLDETGTGREGCDGRQRGPNGGWEKDIAVNSIAV